MKSWPQGPLSSDSVASWAVFVSGRRVSSGVRSAYAPLGGRFQGTTWHHSVSPAACAGVTRSFAPETPT